MLISVKDNPALRQTIRKQIAEIEQVYAWEKVDHILANIYV
jgi:hypothetical protein